MVVMDDSSDMMRFHRRMSKRLLEEDITEEALDLWDAVRTAICAEIARTIDPAKVGEHMDYEERKDDLLAWGKIFAVLGRNARVLLTNSTYGDLIFRFVQQFQPMAPALPAPPPAPHGGLLLGDGSNSSTPFASLAGTPQLTPIASSSDQPDLRHYNATAPMVGSIQQLKEMIKEAK